jgi:hypothetical protein
MDATGLPLSQVQVFLGRAGEEILTSQTDARGDFRFTSLPPGRYTLLAMKSGYVAAFSQVNTLVQRNFDLTLRVLGEPASRDPDAALLEHDRAWMLRLPSRDLLREVDHPTVLSVAAHTEAPGPRPGSFHAEARQWIALGGDTAGPLDGLHTGIDLSGVAGSPVSWTMGGFLERADMEFSNQPLAARERDHGQIALGVRVSPRAGDQVDLTAFLGRTDLQFHSSHAGVGGQGDRDSQVWGYDANWQRRLPSGADLDVQVGYGSARAEGSALGTGESGLSENRWRALGSFQFSPAVGHQLLVGMRADGYDFDSATQRLTLGSELAPTSLLGSGGEGWSLNVFGRETFTLMKPLALEVGLDYRRLGFDETLTYFVPQAGVSYQPAQGQTVRALVLMQFADSSFAAERDRWTEDFDSSPQVGYLLSWEHETPQDLSYALAASVRPFTGETGVEDAAFYRPESGAARFGTDGNASARELSFRLEKRHPVLQSSTGLRIGDVEGSLVSYMPSEIPTQRLARNGARFVSTTVQTSIVPSGTSIQIDYHWVENQKLQLDESRTSPVTYSALDMRIRQDLRRVPGRGDWKVLLGYQEVLNRSEDGGDLSLARLGVAKESHRISGGLSVSF